MEYLEGAEGAEVTCVSSRDGEITQSFRQKQVTSAASAFSKIDFAFPPPRLSASAVSFPDAKLAEAIFLINLRMAVDRELGPQVRDLFAVSTAARSTKWVSTAIPANTRG
jgi:hypothetical protein